MSQGRFSETEEESSKLSVIDDERPVRLKVQK